MRGLIQVTERVSVIVLALTCATLAQDPPHATKGSVLDAVALPGEMYIVGGTLSPYETNNVQVDSYFEQRAVFFSTWNNSLTVTPYVNINLVLDTSGFSWNNKIQPSLGFKLNKHVKGGVFSIGTAYAQESRFRNTDGFHAASARTDFATCWFGWQPSAETTNRWPGSMWAVVGHYSPVEHGNLIEQAQLTQGYAAKRFGNKVLIPFLQINAGHDSKGFDWENKVIGGAGVKLGIPVGEAYAEFGAAYSYEDRYLTGNNANGFKFFMDFSCGWHLFGRRAN
jgi:hypothetical protein